MPALPALLPLLAPAALLGVAVASSWAAGARARRLIAASQWTTLGVLALAAASAALTAGFGAATSPLLGAGGVGLSVRLDALSLTMFVLVAFIGAIVVRFSANYLDGDPRQGVFTGRLCLTLAAVCLLVLSGNLVQLLGGWIATSLALHRLLLFFPGRRGARAAARKKFVVARIGDACLLAAAVLLVVRFGTADIAALLHRVSAADPPRAAALLIATAALLKSAQFPTHGWLPEVMETPTPVSALLHAGIINAGGFLVLRLADVMAAAPVSLHLLAMVGGFTALFGGMAMLTQTSVKASLAWSTVSQMGFMLLECGLGAFPLAVLHIVAHALYKAHAFLASGGVVRASRGVAPVRLGVGLPRLLAGGAIGFALLIAARAAPGVRGESGVVLASGAILAMGLALPIASSLRPPLHRRALALTVARAAGALLACVLLQQAVSLLFAASLPVVPAEPAILALALFGFAGTVVLQALAPAWQATPAGRALLVHLANGFYVNAVTDRWLGTWRATPARRAGP